jgi:hypothetical protein
MPDHSSLRQDDTAAESQPAGTRFRVVRDEQGQEWFIPDGEYEEYFLGTSVNFEVEMAVVRHLIYMLPAGQWYMADLSCDPEDLVFNSPSYWGHWRNLGTITKVSGKQAAAIFVAAGCEGEPPERLRPLIEASNLARRLPQKLAGKMAEESQSSDTPAITAPVPDTVIKQPAMEKGEKPSAKPSVDGLSPFPGHRGRP